MTDAGAVAGLLQAAIDTRDVDALLTLFDEEAVLIGAAGDGRTRAGVRAYLEAVVGQPGPLRWEWDELVVFHEAEDELGFAAFGDVVAGEQRAAIRATFFAVRDGGRWRLRHFHGSIPSG